MKNRFHKLCAMTSIVAVLFTAAPIASPVAHAGINWGKVLGDVLDSVGGGGSSGGGNNGGSFQNLSNQKHAHPNPTNNEAMFILAVEQNDIGTVTDMLNAGVDINGVYPGYNGHQRTALLIAIQKENYEMMQLLLENGADINGFYYYDNKHKAYLEQATTRHSSIELVNYLLNWGIDVNGISEYSFNEKRYAIDNCTYDSTEHLIVQTLIEHGAYLEGRDNNGMTPFLRAVKDGHVQIMQALADGGANINVRDKKGRDAVRIALDGNDLQLSKQVQDIMARGQQPSKYQPRQASRPQTSRQQPTAESADGQDDEMVVFNSVDGEPETKNATRTASNAKARENEINNCLKILNQVQNNETEWLKGFLYIMDNYKTMSVKERVAEAKKNLSMMGKSIATLDSDKIMSTMGNCTPEERELFSDTIQIMRAGTEKNASAMRLFLVERDLTQEEWGQVTKLTKESAQLGELGAEKWKRIREVCEK